MISGVLLGRRSRGSPSRLVQPRLNSETGFSTVLTIDKGSLHNCNNHSGVSFVETSKIKIVSLR